jgi:pimeloyl-ACP methyl ester carboxylesterase
MIGTVIIAQVAATPARKAPPYDTSWYLHPQRLVDVGGRRLNIICMGTGSPAVIFEAGLVADSTAWRLVQPAVSRMTRACSYDRAGLGFSDPTGSPRDAAAIVRDLHALLRGAGVAAPYVLVGWSSGGLYTRLYQYEHPREVAGLVEVDPDSEFESEDDDAKIVTAVMHKSRQWHDAQIRAWYKEYDACALRVSLGGCDFFPGLTAYRKRLRAAGCPAISPAACAVTEIWAEHLNCGSLWKDEELELKASAQGAAELRAAARPYDDLPLIVLTDSENEDIDSDGPISAPAQRAEWIAKDEAEERIARLSTIGAHFVVANSPHAIQLYHPAVVISAIDEVIDQARYGRRQP